MVSVYQPHPQIQLVGRNSVAYCAECVVTIMRRNTAIAYCALQIASYALSFIYLLAYQQTR